MVFVATTLALVLGATIAWVSLDGLRTVERLGLAVGLSVPLGLGVTALQFLLWRVLGGDPFWPVVLPELALLGALAAWAWRRRSAQARVELAGDPRPSVTTLVAIAAVAGVVVIATVALVRLMPSGGWDAWATWNVKARVLALGSDWRLAIDPELSHPDYPLLLPAAVARLMALGAGGGAVVAVAVAAGTVLLPAAILLASRTERSSLIAAALAAGGPALAEQAASQYADLAVGLLLASGLGLLVIARSRDHRGAAALAGLALGLGAWTKNEGLAMYAAAAASILLLAWRDRPRSLRRLAAPFLAASAAVLVPLLLVRSAVPPAYYVADGAGAVLARLAEPSRWLTVGAGVLGWLDPRQHVAPALLLVVCALAARGGVQRGGRLVLAVVGLSLLADAAAYVASPLPLEWQLGTSLGRVLLQLWPSVVVGALLSLRFEAALAVSPAERA